MTTTSERCRALRWGAESLQVAQVAPSAPRDVAELALALAKSYPTPDIIDALEEGEEIKLTPAQVEAIDATAILLRRLPGLGIEPLNVIQGTLRHFPLPWQRNAGFLFWPGA